MTRVLQIAALILALAGAGGAWAAADDEIEYGIQIIGDRELPRSLFIVPWKSPQSSELPVSARIRLEDLLEPLSITAYPRRVDIFERNRRFEKPPVPVRPAPAAR